MTKWTNLKKKAWRGDQNLWYAALWQIDHSCEQGNLHVRVKIDIKRNSVMDSQSHAIAKLFDPEANKWNYAASLPPSQIDCPRFYMRRCPEPEDFESPDKELRAEVELILIGKEDDAELRAVPDAGAGGGKTQGHKG